MGVAHEKSNFQNLQVGHYLRASSAWTENVYQGPRGRPGNDKKGAKFWIWRQTDFRVICTVVLLIQLNKDAQVPILERSGCGLSHRCVKYIEIN